MHLLRASLALLWLTTSVSADRTITDGNVACSHIHEGCSLNHPSVSRVTVRSTDVGRPTTFMCDRDITTTITRKRPTVTRIAREEHTTLPSTREVQATAPSSRTDCDITVSSTVSRADQTTTRAPVFETRSTTKEWIVPTHTYHHHNHDDKPSMRSVVARTDRGLTTHKDELFTRSIKSRSEVISTDREVVNSRTTTRECELPTTRQVERPTESVITRSISRQVERPTKSVITRSTAFNTGHDDVATRTIIRKNELFTRSTKSRSEATSTDRDVVSSRTTTHEYELLTTREYERSTTRQVERPTNSVITRSTAFNTDRDDFATRTIIRKNEPVATSAAEPIARRVTSEDISRVMEYNNARGQELSSSEVDEMKKFFSDINFLCETSSGSPLSKHVQVAANSMKKWEINKNCPQTKPYDGSCTNHAVHKTARIATCGKYLHGMKCHWVVWAAQLLISSCTERFGGESYVGGQVFRNDYVKVVIIKN